MNLFDVQHKLIADRASEAWYRIRVAGPSFHYRWEFGWGSEGNFSNVIGEHHSHAVCREEPSLTMSWGMEVHREERRDLYFGWAQEFVDKTVHAFWVDFFWNNALIDRVELCQIDGGHGTIPIPDAGLEVSDFETAVAYLIHDLEDQPNHDHPGRYLDGIGAKRVRDQDRGGAGSA